MDRSSGLVAAICIPVALFAGVILARAMPDHQSIEWGNLAEWIGGIASLLTVVVAVIALRSWRTQMRATTKHTAANEIGEAASLARYHFYNARNPLYLAAEFPDWYNGTEKRERSRDMEARAWVHVFNGRYRPLHERVLELAKLRAKAIVVFGKELATSLEKVARNACSLRVMFEDRVEQIKVGPEIVSQWSHQDWAQKVRKPVAVDTLQNPQDSFSLDFERDFQALMELLKPYL